MAVITIRIHVAACCPAAAPAAATMLLLFLLQLSSSADGCATNVDCSLNGMCTGGKCVCDKPWSADPRHLPYFCAAARVVAASC